MEFLPAAIHEGAVNLAALSVILMLLRFLEKCTFLKRKFFHKHSNREDSTIVCTVFPVAV